MCDTQETPPAPPDPPEPSSTSVPTTAAAASMISEADSSQGAGDTTMSASGSFKSSAESVLSVVDSVKACGDSKPDSTRPSALPKPSGLKMPTKIGRLCSHSTPKPAVPISPRTSSDGGSSEILRKYSDDYSRKHLADLVEAEEETDGCTQYSDRTGRYHRKASTSSTYSLTSMDALWEKHARRLSEAGLRRSSDHSVVLTEDTDSFIIGEHVWVGGSKPGQIAYIGETQFAPGDWAGIVLDDPIGKNDGSVAGVRYFQCAEKRGVFSRLTRLTRTPLVSQHDASPMSDAGSVFERPPSGLRMRRTLSPSGSVRSAISSKMNMSVTTTGNGSGELKLGDRVIVSSSRGSKAGTLRFVGNADFAPGLWAGVELDDPLGKNDGSVEGKRYFECAPRFGLFAPLSKVSRSPSNRKPGACAIHSNGRATTPLRRSNSRESLTSLGTSIASSVRSRGVRLGVTSLGGAQRVSGPRASSTPVSAKNTLQELLREKQQHLERLMRERELEHAEMARVTLQAGRAETQLAQLRADSLHTTAENDKLKAELTALNKQLEDERQKVEDLMFRTEEENINREDYNKFKQAMEAEKVALEHRVRDLEAEAALQAARAQAQADAAKALQEQRDQDIASLSVQHKEELNAAQVLSSELQKLLDEAYALLREKDNEKDSIGKSMSEELNKVKAESEKALSEAKSKMAVAQTEFETQLSVLNAKLLAAETKLDAEKQNVDRLNKDTSQTVSELNAKLSQIQAALDDKTHELNKVLGSTKEHELSLTKEITKLKMELSAKVLDLEQLLDTNKKQETVSKQFETEMAKLKDEYNKKINEYESLLNDASQQNEKHSSEISELQQKLSSKTSEYEKIINDLKLSSADSEQLLKDFKEKINDRDKEIAKLKNDYEEANANFNKSHSVIAEEHKKLIEERNTKIDQLTKEIESYKQVLVKNKVDFDELTAQFACNVNEIKTLSNRNVTLDKSIIELTELNKALTERINSLELEVSELKRQLHSSSERFLELQKAKEKIEQENISLNGQSSDSNEQFAKLSQHLRETENELQAVREKFREKCNTNERVEQELNQQISKLQQEFNTEKETLELKLNQTQEKLASAEQKVKELFDQLALTINGATSQEQTQRELLLANQTLTKELNNGNQRENELKAELQSLRTESEKTIEQYRQKIDVLKAEGESSEMKLKEKVDQLVEAQNDLNNKLEESRKQEDILQRNLNEFTVQLNNEKTDLLREVTQKESEFNLANEELSKLKAEEVKVHGVLEAKDNAVKELTLKLSMLEVDIKSNLDVIAEKERQIVVANEEVSKIINDKQLLEEKLNSTLSDFSSLQQKHDTLIANNSTGDAIAKEQQEHIDKCKKEITDLTKAKIDFELKCKDLEQKFIVLASDSQTSVEKLEQSVDYTKKLEEMVKDKEKLLTSLKETYEADLSKLSQLQAQIESFQKEVEEKNSLLADKDTKLAQIQQNVATDSSEAAQKIDKLNKDMEELGKNYKSEVETLKKTITSLELTARDHSKQQDELQNSKSKIEELQTLLNKTDEDIKQLTSINTAQKQNYEDLNKQLQSEYDRLKKEGKKERNSLRDKLLEYEKILQETKDKINTEIGKQNDLQTKLTDSEKQRQELSNKLELMTVQHQNTSEQGTMLEKLTLDLQSIRKSSADAIATNEDIINKLKIEVENKINDLRKKDDLIFRLQEDVRNQKAKREVAEREKHLLEKEAAARGKDSNNIVKDNNDNGITKANDNDRLGEMEEIDGQVSFLNSVIVDMQRKNEQLLARVQVLESGSPIHDTTPSEKKPRAIAPRLFCDICDVFDAHDTEDCPRQAGVECEPAPPPPGSRKPPPPQRPYCDICEVFGHATENCDEEETF